MVNKSICIGNYDGLEIYYNTEKKIIEASDNKKSDFNPSILLGLILTATPFLKIINSRMGPFGMKARLLIWIISTSIGLLLGYFVANKIHEGIKLSPMPMNKRQFEHFYSENENRLKTLKWVMICLIVPLFIETYIFIRLGLFMAAFIFLLNIFAVALSFFGGVHSQQKIFGELKQSYMGE